MTPLPFHRRNPAEAIQMQRFTRLFALAITCFSIGSISACAPAQQNLANPAVKGDRSTIQGDSKATALQRTEPE